jgi:hypothetical protein
LLIRYLFRAVACLFGVAATVVRAPAALDRASTNLVLSQVVFACLVQVYYVTSTTTATRCSNGRCLHRIGLVTAVHTISPAAVLLHSSDPSVLRRSAQKLLSHINQQATDMQSQCLGAGRLQQQTGALLSRQQQQCRALCSRHAARQQHAGYNLQPLQVQRMQLLQPRLQLTRQRQLHVVAAAGSQQPEPQAGQTGFLSSLYK